MVSGQLMLWISGAVLVVIGVVFFYLWYSQRGDARNGQRMRRQVVKSLKEMGCKIKGGDGRVQCKEGGGIQGLGEKFSVNAAVSQAIDNFCRVMENRAAAADEEEELMRMRQFEAQRMEAEMAMRQQQQLQQPAGYDHAFNRPPMPTVPVPQYVPGGTPPQPPVPMTYPTPVPHQPLTPDQQQQQQQLAYSQPPQQPSFAPGVFSSMSDSNNNDSQQPLPFKPISTKGDKSVGAGSMPLKYDPKVF